MSNNRVAKTYEEGIEEAISYVKRMIVKSDALFTTPREALENVKVFLENRFKRFI